MTLPDNRPARKPRRLGLIVPWVLAAVLVVAWSGGWFWLKRETEQRMDAARASARLNWSSRSVSGFPFRLNVDLKDARWSDALGWSVTAPILKAQAYVSAPTHWTFVAPGRVVLTRGRDESVTVTADVLRASVSEFDRQPARISVEGVGLHFAPSGAGSFPLIAAREFHLHTRAGPSDQGALYVEINQGLIRAVSPEPTPTDLIFDAVYSHAGAFNDPDWPHAIRAWDAAGGHFAVRRVLFRIGGATLIDARSGDLTVGADGRLRGVLDGRGTPTTPIPLLRVY